MRHNSRKTQNWLARLRQRCDPHAAARAFAAGLSPRELEAELQRLRQVAATALLAGETDGGDVDRILRLALACQRRLDRLQS